MSEKKIYINDYMPDNVKKMVQKRQKNVSEICEELYEIKQNDIRPLTKEEEDFLSNASEKINGEYYYYDEPRFNNPNLPPTSDEWDKNVTPEEEFYLMCGDKAPEYFDLESQIITSPKSIKSCTSLKEIIETYWTNFFFDERQKENLRCDLDNPWLMRNQDLSCCLYIKNEDKKTQKNAPVLFYQVSCEYAKDLPAYQISINEITGWDFGDQSIGEDPIVINANQIINIQNYIYKNEIICSYKDGINKTSMDEFWELAEKKILDKKVLLDVRVFTDFVHEMILIPLTDAANINPDPTGQLAEWDDKLQRQALGLDYDEIEH